MLKVFTDGGSRGNPGESACACVFLDENNQEKFSASSYLGIKTNNEAEYNGVLLALVNLKAHFPTKSEINFYLDSKLVVEQLSGRWKIKDARIKDLVISCKNKIATQNLTVTFTHVPRSENKLADALVNQCLDNQTLQ